MIRPMKDHIPLLWYLEEGVSSPLAFQTFDDWYSNLVNVEIPALGEEALLQFIWADFSPEAWVLLRRQQRQ